MTDKPYYADELLAGILHIRVSARQYYGLTKVADEQGARGYGHIVRKLIDEYLAVQHEEVAEDG